jgi:hypothetical protein
MAQPLTASKNAITELERTLEITSSVLFSASGQVGAFSFDWQTATSYNSSGKKANLRKDIAPTGEL